MKKGTPGMASPFGSTLPIRQARYPPVRKASTASTMAITRMIQMKVAAMWKTPPRPSNQARTRMTTRTQSRFPTTTSYIATTEEDRSSPQFRAISMPSRWAEYDGARSNDMDSSEFEDLFAQVKQVGNVLKQTFEDVTGEELDPEAAIRHYPLVAVGLAAGAGLVGGWWLGRRSSRRQLPAPGPQTPVESALDRLRDLRARLRAENGAGQAGGPLEYLEQIIPGGLDAVRGMLPEGAAEEASSMARDWLSNVVEPRLRQGLENAVESASRGSFGAFLKETLEYLEGTEDRKLDDPEA